MDLGPSHSAAHSIQAGCGGSGGLEQGLGDTSGFRASWSHPTRLHPPGPGGPWQLLLPSLQGRLLCPLFWWSTTSQGDGSREQAVPGNRNTRPQVPEYWGRAGGVAGWQAGEGQLYVDSSFLSPTGNGEVEASPAHCLWYWRHRKPREPRMCST